MQLRWNWGTGVALVYSIFACATAGFVVYAMDTPTDLVSPDYYARSLHEEQRIEARRNASTLEGVVGCRVDDRTGALLVRIPAEHVADVAGTLTLYRPSGVGDDRTITLTPDRTGTQRVSSAGLPPGKWIAQMNWTSGGRAFYVEQAVMTR